MTERKVTGRCTRGVEGLLTIGFFICPSSVVRDRSWATARKPEIMSPVSRRYSIHDPDQTLAFRYVREACHGVLAFVLSQKRES